MTYIEAITHVRKFKNFYSLKQIAEHMGIAPSMLRSIVDERPIVNKTRKNYIMKMPEKHKAKFIDIITMLTSVQQIEAAQMINDETDLFFRGGDQSELL